MCDELRVEIETLHEKIEAEIAHNREIEAKCKLTHHLSHQGKEILESVSELHEIMKELSQSKEVFKKKKDLYIIPSFFFFLRLFYFNLVLFIEKCKHINPF